MILERTADGLFTGDEGNCAIALAASYLKTL